MGAIEHVDSREEMRGGRMVSWLQTLRVPLEEMLYTESIAEMLEM